MSFSFSFSGDDIEDDATPGSTLDEHNDTSESADTLTSKLQNTTLKAALFPPKRHTLLELLTALPSQISYNYLDVPLPGSHQPTNNGTDSSNSGDATTIRVPRRSLFDIRQQLMAESDPANNDDETVNLLSGLEMGDLTIGVYEGGFKTWECAVDLAGFVSSALDGQESTHIIELGAGSAVPSLVLLTSLLRRRRSHEQGQHGGKVKFTLCDYNEDVLRLGTAVNVLLVTALVFEEIDRQAEHEEEGDIDVDEDLVLRVLKALEATNVEVDFISGAWRDEFVQQVIGEKEKEDASLLLLASETIYSPDSLHVFSRTVLDILRSTTTAKRAYIAAKKVYFGVGGGVQEFEEEMTRVGGRVDTVLDVKSAGVGRVILEVIASQ